MMKIPLGDFNRGPLAAAPFVVGMQRVAANICYEDLFGEELAARFESAASAPTLFANISNIGWFGDTIAVDQHLQISRMRSLEFQLPMLRATNTGATVVIDHRGRVTGSLAPFTQGVLNAEVETREGLTPFAWWASRFGLWPLWLVGGLTVLAFARLANRSR
jgi:apolipoprotein N-acyltransferase